MGMRGPGEDGTDQFRQIFDLEAIKRLKARYFRCLDTKDWAGWSEVFTDDATLRFYEAVLIRGAQVKSGAELQGRPTIVDFVRNRLGNAQTVHHGHMREIDVISIRRRAESGPWRISSSLPPEAIHGFGHYHETYREVDGARRIAR